MAENVLFNEHYLPSNLRQLLNFESRSQARFDGTELFLDADNFRLQKFFSESFRNSASFDFQIANWVLTKRKMDARASLVKLDKKLLILKFYSKCSMKIISWKQISCLSNYFDN